MLPAGDLASLQARRRRASRRPGILLPNHRGACVCPAKRPMAGSGPGMLRHSRRPYPRDAGQSRDPGCPTGQLVVTYNRCTIQMLADTQDGDPGREHPADPAAVDAVLTASRTLVAVSTRSLGEAAEQKTIAQYRMLVVLASRGPQRMVDLAAALDVAPSTAGRMTDRLVRKKLARRHRARTDRRSVVVSLTAEGRQVVDEATARRRVLIEDILAWPPENRQHALASVFATFAAAAGEVPEHLWPLGPAAPSGCPVQAFLPLSCTRPGLPERDALSEGHNDERHGHSQRTGPAGRWMRTRLAAGWPGWLVSAGSAGGGRGGIGGGGVPVPHLFFSPGWPPATMSSASRAMWAALICPGWGWGFSW